MNVITHNPHIANEVTHEQLMSRAKKVRRITQNPATLAKEIGDAGALDMPRLGEFHD